MLRAASDTDNTALLVMEVEPGIVDWLRDRGFYLARVKAAVGAAHAERVRISSWLNRSRRSGYGNARGRTSVVSTITISEPVT